MAFMNIAHRGFSGRYPENTLLSFQKAIELGCTWLECDIRYTSDEEPVVIHDATVDRTTDGSGPVTNLTLAEIRELDAGTWKAPEFAGEKIPTLRELLDCIRDRAELVVEVKCGVDHVEDVVRRVRDAGCIEGTVASAFEWDVILALRELAPDWRTTWLTNSGTEALEQCVAAGVRTFGPPASATDETLVRAAHDLGLEVRCWALGDDKGPEMRRLIAVGADGTTTNHPDVLMRILAEE